MSKNEYDFDEEFMSDEEVLESFDNLISCFKEQNDGKEVTGVVNPDKVHDILQAYRILKSLTQGTKAKVELALNEPFASAGSVSVIGRDISFTNSKLFIQAVELAENIDVYPRTDGTIEMDLGFHGVAKIIDTKEGE